MFWRSLRSAIQTICEVTTFCHHTTRWLEDAGSDTEAALNSIGAPLRYAKLRPGSLNTSTTFNIPEALDYGQSSLAKNIDSMSFSYIDEGLVNTSPNPDSTRPWFSRRWVVRELAVAPQATLMCEPHELGWTEIEALVSLSTRTIPHVERLAEQRRIYQNREEDAGDLARLLCSSADVARATIETGFTQSRFQQSVRVSNVPRG